MTSVTVAAEFLARNATFGVSRIVREAQDSLSGPVARAAEALRQDPLSSTPSELRTALLELFAGIERFSGTVVEFHGQIDEAARVLALLAADERSAGAEPGSGERS